VSRQVTYVLKFYRNKEVLDIEIHPDLDSASSNAYSYVACFCSSRDATVFEQILNEWDDVLGPLAWSDDEYMITLDSQEARHTPKEDNQCRIIPFRQQVA
jgi:hypothetical protein